MQNTETKNKESKRSIVRISCDSDKSLLSEFNTLINTVVNGKLCATNADVLRGLLDFYTANNEVLSKKDLFADNTGKGTIDIKLRQVTDMLMKYNRSAKRDMRVYIDTTLLRSIAGTDANKTKLFTSDNKTEIEQHHETYNIIKDHNVKFRKTSEYPVLQVTKSRVIKKFFYDMIKEHDIELLNFLGLSEVSNQSV